MPTNLTRPSLTEIEKLILRLEYLERWTLFLDRMLLLFLILSTVQTAILISIMIW